MGLIKLSIIFIVILGLLSFRVKLDLAMLAASVLLVIFFSIPISQAAITLLQSVIAWNTISMVLIVWFVMILEGLMSQRGALEKLLDRFNAVFHSKRLNIVAMPMIIGFLPSAGGALFSAPIVEKAAQGEGFSPERMTIINIYYRHVMEVFFPTYASLMMAASITGLSLSRLSTALLPVAIFVMLFGLVLVRGVKHSESPGKDNFGPLGSRILSLLIAMWPFLAMLLLITVIGIPVALGMGITLVLYLLIDRVPLATLPKTIWKATKWRLLIMVVIVLVFKDLLTVSGAVANLPEIIARLPIPPTFVFSLLAFFIALLVGMPMPATVIVLPLLMASGVPWSLGVVGFVHLSGYIGAQLTPTHMCVSITNEYFQGDIQRVLVGSLPLYLIIYAVSALYCLILL